MRIPRSLFICAVLVGCWAGDATPRPTSPELASSPSPQTPATVNPENTAAQAPSRPEEDVARDAKRHPQAVMDFFGIERGDRVVELLAGGGYYSALLSARVGPQGAVWAHNTPFVLNRFAEPKIAARLENPDLANVKRLDTELESPELPGDLDAVLMVLFYHDLYWQGVDRVAMNRAIFAALPPGGVFGIIDHAALDGHGSDDVKTLHRVEESLVTREVLAAGFELEATSELLRNASDPRDYNVFDPPPPAERDQTDRFMLRFVKPAS